MARATSRWISRTRSSLGWQNWDHAATQVSTDFKASSHNCLASCICSLTKWEYVTPLTSFLGFLLLTPSPGVENPGEDSQTQEHAMEGSLCR